jgi:hypothetical protein
MSERCPFSQIGFFDKDKNLLFDGEVSESGVLCLSSITKYDLQQLPNAIAVCKDTVSPYFVMFPAVDSFSSEEPFSKAVQGTILGDSPPLDTEVFLVVHGAKKAWNSVEIISRKTSEV